MPIYDYHCEKCDLDVEISKSMSDSRNVEKCTQCGNTLDRVWNANVHFVGTKVTDAEYYPSLGKVIKSNYHRSEEMKRNNLIEVGNEKPDRIRYYTERYRKEKLAKDYDD